MVAWQPRRDHKTPGSDCDPVEKNNFSKTCLVWKTTKELSRFPFFGFERKENKQTKKKYRMFDSEELAWHVI